MSQRLSTVVADLQTVADEVVADFAGLPSDLLGRTPGAGGWSAAQCFEHLITTNRLYFPLFETLAAGGAPPTLWQRLSPFSGVFGRLLIRSLSPESSRKVKTSPKAEPTASPDAARIIERFVGHQAELIGRIRALPASIDLRRTVITSPLAGVITYSLDDCLTILVVHERRHVQQAHSAVR